MKDMIIIEAGNNFSTSDFDISCWADTLMPGTQCGHTTPVDADTKFSAQDLCSPIGHTGGN